MKARCAGCGGESFHLGAGGDDGAIACAACGRALEAPWEAPLGEVRADLRSIRDELNRLRQAVNFLNQRVR